MQPENDRSTHPSAPLRGAPLQVGSRPNDNSQQAASVVRNQIDRIYQQDDNATMPNPALVTNSQASLRGPVEYTPSSSTDSSSPYERTRSQEPSQVSQSTWQRYHSAWQNYYQQYYERYYVTQVEEAKQTLERDAKQQQSSQNQPVTEQQALRELKGDLLSKVKAQTSKARQSKHFFPVAAAFFVMLTFLFLQYNRVLFASVAAYVSPGNVNPANIIVDPSDISTVTAEDRLIIPKINVDVPIIWSANAADQTSLNDAMNNGVVWFNVQQAHSRPGENGNFVLSGHSSNDWLDQGDYKFIFAPLEQLKVGDTFYVNYNKQRYVYQVSGTSVVPPTAVDALQTDNSKPIITLITCTPLGTALNRLLVFADQISPDPTKAAIPSTLTDSSTNQMPTNSPTLLERLFGR